MPNAKAIEHIVTAGLAFGAQIPAFSKFDRKNYFYPDMPKDYQISQYDMPLAQGGSVPYWLDDGTRKECRLTRIHLEEDTGKSTHAGSGDGRIAGSSYSLLDFNRAGVPLMECVSEPELHTAAEAIGYLESLRRTLLALGVSDVKMEEGSLRCDANVSIRPAGSSELGTKAEIKNMNSFRSVQRAIESEIERQIEIVVVRRPRGAGDARLGRGQRRHALDAQQRRGARLPLLPGSRPGAARNRARRRRIALASALPRVAAGSAIDRYAGDYGFGAKQATQLVDNLELADYFDRVVALSKNPQQSSNFVLGELSRLANETGTSRRRIGGVARASRRAHRAGGRQADQLQDRQGAAQPHVGRRRLAGGDRRARGPGADERSRGARTLR